MRTVQAAGGPVHTARDAGVDRARVAMAFLVILCHCLPNPDLRPHLPLVTLLVGAAARVAVPFFFVASGLFLAVRDEPLAATARRTAARLLRLHLLWLAVYLAVFSTPLPSFPWQWKPSILWTGGPGFQLWFLPALAASQFAVAAALPRIGTGWTVAAAAGLAAVGLAVVYGLAAPHAPPFWFPRLCQGPALVLAGRLVAARPRLATGPAALLVALAYLCSVGEDWLVARATGLPVSYQEFTLSTCLLGVAATLFARAPRGAPEPALRWRPARLSLQLYCVHVLFLWPLLHAVGSDTPARSALLFTAVSALSLGAALAWQALTARFRPVRA